MLIHVGKGFTSLSLIPSWNQIYTPLLTTQYCQINRENEKGFKIRKKIEKKYFSR